MEDVVGDTYTKARGTAGRVSGNYSMPPQLHAQLKAFAEKRDLSVSRVVQRAVTIYLAEEALGTSEAAF